MNLFCRKGSDKSSNCIVKKLSDKRKQALAEREAELLDIAEQLVEAEGFANFTMDKLTANCRYSKGTVYNHFNSKEDLISALCIKSLQIETALFKHALTFAGNSRERCLAALYAYQLHAVNNPTQFMCVLTAKTPAVLEKASPERIAEQNRLARVVTDMCDDLFRAGIADGSLKAKPDLAVEQLTFAVWAMSFGTNALLISANALESLKRLNNDLATLTHANLLFDGIDWQPLSHQWDYQKSWQRIATELFDHYPLDKTEQ